jgi:hypothetical protein
MMNKKRKKKDHLTQTERAMRNVLAHELNQIIVDRSRGNANGTHQNPAERRIRTRSAAKRRAIEDQQ